VVQEVRDRDIGSLEEEVNALHLHERSGRPLGNEIFVEALDKTLKRILRPKKPGPKKKLG
jgi:putative transposase